MGIDEETYWTEKGRMDVEISNQILRYYDAKLKIDKLVAEAGLKKLDKEEFLPDLKAISILGI